MSEYGYVTTSDDAEDSLVTSHPRSEYQERDAFRYERNLSKHELRLRQGKASSSCTTEGVQMRGIYSLQRVGIGNRCHPEQKHIPTSITLSKPVIPEENCCRKCQRAETAIIAFC